MAPEIGGTAPAFTLPDAQRQPVSLGSVLAGGRSALVVFYPFAFSGICGGELQAVCEGDQQNDCRRPHHHAARRHQDAATRAAHVAQRKLE